VLLIAMGALLLLRSLQSQTETERTSGGQG
jgi:hypothetical protein